MLLLGNFKLKFLLGPFLSCILLGGLAPCFEFISERIESLYPGIPRHHEPSLCSLRSPLISGSPQASRKHSQGPVLRPIISGHRPPSLHHPEKTL